MLELIEKVTKWHHDRNLIDGSTDRDQIIKLQEELDELKASVEKEASPIDDLGDMLVVMINIAERNDLHMAECLAHAYNEIKDRKGKIIDGIYVKETTPPRASTMEEKYVHKSSHDISQYLKDLAQNMQGLKADLEWLPHSKLLVALAEEIDAPRPLNPHALPQGITYK